MYRTRERVILVDLEKVNKTYWLEGGRNKILELEKKRDGKIQEELDNIRLKDKVFRFSSSDINNQLVSLMLPHYEWLYEIKMERKVSYERILKSVVCSNSNMVININGGFFKDTLSFTYKSNDANWIYFFKKVPYKKWSTQFKYKLLLAFLRKTPYYLHDITGVSWGSNEKNYYDSEDILLKFSLYNMSIKFADDYEYSEKYLLGFGYESELVKNNNKEQAEKEALEKQKQLDLEQKIKAEKEGSIIQENELLEQQIIELNEQHTILVRHIERNKQDIRKSTKALKKLHDYLDEKKEAYNRMSYREKQIFEELGKNE